MVRDDLQHLIIDIGRSRGKARNRWTRAHRVAKDDLDLQHEAVRPNGAYFRDRLTPLQRYLHKQVGRPWRRVYSELCRAFDRRSIRGFHLHSHLRDFVLLDVLKTDKGYRPQTSYHRRGFWNHELFVDEHGLLRQPRAHELARSKRRRREQRRAKQEASVRHTEAGVYVKVEGLWWLLELVPAGEIGSARVHPEFKIVQFDPDREIYVWKPLAEAGGRWEREELQLFPKRKRQVGRAEIRRQRLEVA